MGNPTESELAGDTEHSIHYLRCYRIREGGSYGMNPASGGNFRCYHWLGQFLGHDKDLAKRLEG
ncbi:MAG: hypothetical protein ABGZ35_01715 [Planctomycetaceae bacterium]